MKMKNGLNLLLSVLRYHGTTNHNTCISNVHLSATKRTKSENEIPDIYMVMMLARAVYRVHQFPYLAICSHEPIGILHIRKTPYWGGASGWLCLR